MTSSVAGAVADPKTVGGPEQYSSAAILGRASPAFMAWTVYELRHAQRELGKSDPETRASEKRHAGKISEHGTPVVHSEKCRAIVPEILKAVHKHDEWNVIDPDVVEKYKDSVWVPASHCKQVEGAFVDEVLVDDACLPIRLMESFVGPVKAVRRERTMSQSIFGMTGTSTHTRAMFSSSNIPDKNRLYECSVRLDGFLGCVAQMLSVGTTVDWEKVDAYVSSSLVGLEDYVLHEVRA